MAFYRVRPLLPFGLLGCATLALVPLGCGAKITYPAASEGPRVPGATAERLRACVDEFGGDLRGGYYVFDYTVKVDEEGRVVDVASKGVPHADLAGCTRLALRAMTVPEDLLRLRKLRLSESPAPANGQAAGERGLVGHPGVLVAVAIALADLVIEVGPVIIVMAAELELSKDIAETIQKRPRWEESCNKRRTDCLGTDLADQSGDIEGSSMCEYCRRVCNAQRGQWPEQVDGRSCEYWLPKWKR
ncbi:hypothetical protein [Polyangium jinanense]|uniref:Uncharacterized protein n=1 Tax=Polyangium jinanense TaxID=2829994 RepID=A0A9X4AVA5_9BACT|nr:hypothetical protein [Polyangium jinanense]MDC3984080.1 hypothetical protein [Polyangium jinanense]